MADTSKLSEIAEDLPGGITVRRSGERIRRTSQGESGESSRSSERRRSRKRASVSPSSLEVPDAKRQNSGRKSKRRSSFVRGRISKPLPALSTTDLVKGIPDGLPPAERLSKLIHACLNYTFQKMEDEGLGNLERFTENQIEIRAVVDDSSIPGLEKEGALTLAVQKESCLPNPANIELEKSIQYASAYINRLQQERDTWDEMKSTRTEAADEAKRLYNEPKEVITDREQFLTRPEKLILNSSNLTDTIESLNRNRNRTALQVKEIQKHVLLLKSFEDAADKFTGEQAHRLEAISFEGVEKDSKNLITNILAM